MKKLNFIYRRSHQRVNDFLTWMEDDEVCLINVQRKFISSKHNKTRLRFSLIDTSNANKLLFVQNRLVSSAKMWK